MTKEQEQMIIAQINGLTEDGDLIALIALADSVVKPDAQWKADSEIDQKVLEAIDQLLKNTKY